MRLLSQEEQRIEQYWDALDPEIQENIGRQAYEYKYQWDNSNGWFLKWRYLHPETKGVLMPHVIEAMNESKKSHRVRKGSG